jgi:hypothetical protein
MIGSRALGTAQPDSDLDLVVLAEVPRGASAWGPAENLAERDRIQGAVGRLPVTTDLLVRTTDHYCEARGVVGGVEYLVDREGVDVYARALEHPPTIRRNAEQVRRANAGTWITHASAVLEELAAHPRSRESASAGPASAMRSVTALLVTHQLHSSKRDGIRQMLGQLAAVDSPTAAQLLVSLESAEPPFRKAHAVLRTAVARLAQDPGMLPHLRQARAWLRKVEALQN